MMAARASVRVCSVDRGRERSNFLWRNSECVLKMAARKRLHILPLLPLLLIHHPFSAVSLGAASAAPVCIWPKLNTRGDALAQYWEATRDVISMHMSLLATTDMRSWPRMQQQAVGGRLSLEQGPESERQEQSSARWVAAIKAENLHTDCCCCRGCLKASSVHFVRSLLRSLCAPPHRHRPIRAIPPHIRLEIN